MVNAISNELALQADFLSATHLSSIYFGGGTPSLLTQPQLKQLFDAIRQYFTWDEHTEITLEANPDDLDEATLARLAQSPINRLSIGIQSFIDNDLRAMHRAHSAAEAHQCIIAAKAAGFENLTIDLMYGMPNRSLKEWQYNVDTFLALEIPHLSSYCLTIEPKTALAHQIKKGQVKLPEEEAIEEQYHYLHNQLAQAGYQHYEISNFAQPGYLAKHNTGYWQGQSYLGVGPSAHSYKPGTRQWNVAHNQQYIDAINANRVPATQESIDETTAFNEYLLTGLRTAWGIDLIYIRQQFGDKACLALEAAAAPFIFNKQMTQQDNNLCLTPKAWLLSDGIIAALFQ